MVKFEPTERSKVKRGPGLAVYARDAIYRILDAGLMCHVGYVRGGEPYVTPTAYWRAGDRIYWHGSSASRMIRAAGKGIPVCLSVSHLDGLVFARSGFHTSLNYRSVLIYGEARVVADGTAKEAALKDFMERIAPGRWDSLRPPDRKEMKATTVLFMEIDEAVAKARTGGPIDDPGDVDAPVWAGVVPLKLSAGDPQPDELVTDDIETPGYCRDVAIG